MISCADNTPNGPTIGATMANRSGLHCQKMQTPYPRIRPRETWLTTLNDSPVLAEASGRKHRGPTVKTDESTVIDRDPHIDAYKDAKVSSSTTGIFQKTALDPLRQCSFRSMLRNHMTKLKALFTRRRIKHIRTPTGNFAICVVKNSSGRKTSHSKDKNDSSEKSKISKADSTPESDDERNEQIMDWATNVGVLSGLSTARQSSMSRVGNKQSPGTYCASQGKQPFTSFGTPQMLTIVVRPMSEPDLHSNQSMPGSNAPEDLITRETYVTTRYLYKGESTRRLSFWTMDQSREIWRRIGSQVSSHAELSHEVQESTVVGSKG